MGSLHELIAALEAPQLASPRIPRAGRRSGHKDAAVAILVSTDDPARVVLIERSSQLRHHPGQVAFPGGGVEPSDATLIATALREMHEEIGLPADRVRVIASLPKVGVAVSGYNVTPVVATWDRTSPICVSDPIEVANVHEIELRRLADPSNRVSFVHSSGTTGPAFAIDGLFIWGLTGFLLSWVIDLGRWHRDWDASRTRPV